MDESKYQAICLQTKGRAWVWLLSQINFSLFRFFLHRFVKENEKVFFYALRDFDRGTNPFMAVARFKWRCDDGCSSVGVHENSFVVTMIPSTLMT